MTNNIISTKPSQLCSKQILVNTLLFNMLIILFSLNIFFARRTMHSSTGVYNKQLGLLSLGTCGLVILTWHLTWLLVDSLSLID
uniref:Uncharacterized protein n=1 Tax=Oryza brachyantha TaxID=4533 RepID=J3KX71_ORYBR